MPLAPPGHTLRWWGPDHFSARGPPAFQAWGFPYFSRPSYSQLAFSQIWVRAPLPPNCALRCAVDRPAMSGTGYDYTCLFLRAVFGVGVGHQNQCTYANFLTKQKQTRKFSTSHTDVISMLCWCHLAMVPNVLLLRQPLWGKTEYERVTSRSERQVVQTNNTTFFSCGIIECRPTHNKKTDWKSDSR